MRASLAEPKTGFRCAFNVGSHRPELDFMHSLWSRQSCRLKYLHTPSARVKLIVYLAGKLAGLHLKSKVRKGTRNPGSPRTLSRECVLWMSFGRRQTWLEHVSEIGLCQGMTWNACPDTRLHDHLRSRVCLSWDAPGGDDCERNIQIADLNALSAALAVMKWKKLFGFYRDLKCQHHSQFGIDTNGLLNEDRSQ